MHSLPILASLVLALATPALAKPRPERCPGGRFIVTGAPLLPDDPASAHGPVTIESGRVSIGSACPPVKAKLKASRRGTIVRARWGSKCPGMRGAGLTATIGAGCAAMEGTFRCRKPRISQPFAARLSSCGDGVVDPGRGEQCDGEGCAAGSVCTDCECIDVPTTTSPATTSTTSTTTTTTVSAGTTSTTELPSTTTTTTTSTTTTTLSLHGSVARQWNEELLAAVRLDTPRPTVHARNLFHMSVAMWDAWAAYDDTASQYLANERATAADVETARKQAISFAAYLVLRERYADSVGKVTALARFDARMDALGYDRNFTSTDGDSPAALGNRIAALVLAYGDTDGANEGADHSYKDPTYTPANPALVVKLPLPAEQASGGGGMIDPDRWQPLALDYFLTQNGIPEPISVQTFIGSHWGDVKPFAMARQDPGDIYHDPGPPAQFGSEDYRERAVDLIRKSSHLTPDDGVMIDVSPGARGNNPLGTNDGTGHPLNPVTGQPYAPNVVKRGDWARVLAEFWADGPNSETPPGHWNVLANEVSDALAEKRFGGTGGTGPLMTDLEWDVKLYLALNGAVHDAAIGAWGTKRRYDSSRPITMVRFLARLGQSSDPGLPHYHPDGLPLIPGLIELITDETTVPGGRHCPLAESEDDCALDGFEGEIAILVWPGQPPIPLLQYSGVQWVLGRWWIPFQKNTFVTPAFAGYTSGHSTFSRAAAEVLTAFTGSPYFPGGLEEVRMRRHAYLTFELGPSQDVVLQSATYYDAADDAGTSRLYGGIHPLTDDLPARIMGSQIGMDAVDLATQYFDGTVAP